MSAIKLDGLTLASTANSAVNLDSSVVFPAHHIIQVVYQSGTTETSDTSGSTVTLYCGWTASITLSSASNKILLSLVLPFQLTRATSSQAYFEDLLLHHQQGTLTTSGSGGTLQLTGASSSTIADLFPYRLNTGGTLDGVITYQTLRTTSDVNNHFTFSAIVNSDMSSGYFNRQFGDGSVYNITLMEVVG